MTVSPIAPPPPGAGRGGASRSSSDTGFAALVEHHLAAGQSRPDARAAGPRERESTDGVADRRDASRREAVGRPAGDLAGSAESRGSTRPPGTSKGRDAAATSGGQDGASTGSAGAPYAVPTMLGGTSPTASTLADQDVEPAPSAEGQGAGAADGKGDGTAAQGLAGTTAAALPTLTVAGAATAGTAAASTAGPLAGSAAGSTAAAGQATSGSPRSPHVKAEGAGRGATAQPSGASPSGAKAVAGTPTGPVSSDVKDSSDSRDARGDAPATGKAASPADSIGTSAMAPQGADTPQQAGASQQAGTPHVVGATQASQAPADGGARPAVPGNAVTAQVFDHVTRLVSRGDGTHRLMLRLHPADLGEVKVVLTVRNNTVDVTLSAGPAARDALREGSPQLRALLELTGATAGQVVIRDHAGALATHGAVWTGQGQPGAGQAGAGQPGSGQPGAGQNGSSQPGPGQNGSGQPGQGHPGAQHAGQALGQQAGAGSDGRSGPSGGTASSNGDPSGGGAHGIPPARAGRDPAAPAGFAAPSSAGSPTYPQTATRLDLDL